MKRVAAIFQRSLMVGFCLMLAVPTFAQRGGGRGGGGGGGGMGSGGGGGRPGGGGGGGNAGGGGGARGGSGFVGNPYNMGPTPASAYAGANFPGYGFGSVVFPGGSTGFGYSTPTNSLNNAFSTRLGNTVAGVPTSNFIGGGGNINRGRTAVYPVFVGGGYGYGYGSGYGYGYNGYQDSPQVTIINAQPSVPSVIINQGYEPDPPARPVMRVYGDGAVNTGVNTIQVPSPSYPEGNPIRPGSIEIANASTTSAPASEEPNVYMIALRDGTIYASYAYWTERDMLHYITPGHAHNQVSMDRVDLTLTRRLNRERNLDFSLR